MGAAFRKVGDGTPPSCCEADPPATIRGSKWRHERELMSISKCKSAASLVYDMLPRERRVDWSGVAQAAFGGLADSGKLTCTWLDPLLVCAVAIKGIGAAKLSAEPASSSSAAEVIVLDKSSAGPVQGLPGSILRIKKPAEEVLMQLVSRHPVVTSLRCTQSRLFHWSLGPEGSAALGLNPQHCYSDSRDEAFDLNCIPRCGVLVGYDRRFWTVFDPAFDVTYKVLRTDIRNGVGEFVLVPL